MLFNSIDFAIFLPIVFAIYWIIGSERRKFQNFFLLIASYVFYGWWNQKFLILIFLSTLVDYFVAKGIENNHDNKKKQKVFITSSLIFNLGMLGFFKYFNFFAENFVQAFTLFGIHLNQPTLEIILPVGISFYTFQTLSYSIDVCKGKLPACKDFISFAAYVSFFPQLVAGPIERATNLVPQFLNKRTFDYYLAVDGMKQILWGLFKKIVIADSCAKLVNPFFENYSTYPGADLIICSVLFAFQIYCDFSGYSDIAIGTARLFGFNLMRNFSFPYFSRDVAEFWRRWHISLTTWFRDYIYIPLGGSRRGLAIVIRNTFIIYLVSGFWHGARWTFIFWGLLNALYFLPLLIRKKNRKHLDIVASDRKFPNFKELLSMLTTFALITFAWIFFRATSMEEAVKVIYHCLKDLIQHPASILLLFRELYLPQIILLTIFITIEWFGRRNQYAIQSFLVNNNVALRWSMYYAIIIAIILSFGEKQDFIYFQF
jgi:D-alanyl-lipoteichoic acid acyltransferase DltB (MBOAT superfamily)